MSGRSLGGHPTTAVPAQVVGAASRSVNPNVAHTVMSGGVPWVDEAPRCTSTMKSNGWPCDQAPRPGKHTCFGHRHDEE